MQKSLELGMRLLLVCAAVACGSDSDDLFASGKDKDLFADGGGATSGNGGSSGESGSSGEGGSGAVGAVGGAGSGEGGGGSSGAAGEAGDAGTTDASADDGASDAAGAGGTASDAGTGGSAGVGNCTNPVTYYADTDKDGHGDPRTSVRSCSQPAGYVTSSDDCYDGNKQANPNQTGWFLVERGDNSFDYDCDGNGTPRFPEVGRCQSLAICQATEGWQEAVPACGAEKAWITGCVFPLCTPPTTELRKLECH